MKFLENFLFKIFTISINSGTINTLKFNNRINNIIKCIIDFLIKLKIPFTYIFINISGSLIIVAERTFTKQNIIQFIIIDIKKQLYQKFLNNYHYIISINYIHTTKDLPNLIRNINKIFQPDRFI